MKLFIDGEEIRNQIESIFENHKAFIIGTMEPEVDPQVSAQKTRWFKFWCWAKFGHLLDKKGVCMRCGKVLIINNNK